MPKLARFSTPAKQKDLHPEAWSDRVGGLFANYVDGHLPQFYDPRKTNTPPGAPEPMVSWVAFPARLRAQVHTEERWKIADGNRAQQDEYCEWTVARNAARKITRITFTSEVPEYYEHLLATDPHRLVTLYRELVDPHVKLSDLRGPNGRYKRENKWNTSKPGRLAHLIQSNNNLAAAIDLVANATVLRESNGEPVVNQQALVKCGLLGNELRNSDPQIAQAVNNAARTGAEITLADPPGLHLGRPLTAGMVTPDGADAARFWKIERGNKEHTLRARFEVPPEKKYVVGDIKIEGRPIQFGAQVADRVQVWVKAVVKPAKHAEKPKPCRA